MKSLRLSPDLTLPLDAAVQKFAFLARSGAGKTYAAGVLVEQLHKAGAQVVVVDGVGVWWGLRLAADGKAPGIAIPVFGGQHGDIPLEATAGELVADLIANKGLSVVLDVSEFTGADQRRFVTAFATALLHLKKKHRSPVMIVWEECQDFVPQKVMGESAKMVGAMERLIKQGRNFGVGTSLISQRPQAVNKDVLNQTEVLVVLQTTGPQERKAIEGWIVDKGLDRAVMDGLPSLPVGVAHLWSPQWLKVFKKITIGKKHTYDASATPTALEDWFDEGGRRLATVDLDEVKTAMAATIKRAEENDPSALRRRIITLENELRKKGAPVAKVVEVPALKAAQIQKLESAVASLRLWEARVETSINHLNSALSSARAIASIIGTANRVRPPEPKRTTLYAAENSGPPLSRRREQRPPRSVVPINGSNGYQHGDALPLGEEKVLAALIQYPNGLDRSQLTVLTGYKRSTRDAYLARLKDRGYVDVAGTRMIATEDGRKALPDYSPPPVGVALRDHWTDRLPAGEGAILEQLIQAYPQSVERNALGEATGFKRSTRDAYLSRLAAKELIEDAGRGAVRASETLFMER